MEKVVLKGNGIKYFDPKSKILASREWWISKKHRDPEAELDGKKR